VDYTQSPAETIHIGDQHQVEFARSGILKQARSGWSVREPGESRDAFIHVDGPYANLVAVQYWLARWRWALMEAPSLWFCVAVLR